jgi:hypothetical protein
MAKGLPGPFPNGPAHARLPDGPHRPAGRPRSVAVYLASDASTYAVGQAIFIDGGVLADA